MPETSETVVQIDLTALEHNYNYLKARLDSSTKFLAVVKAFAYGNGAVRIAQKLETLGVDYFAVAYTNEGVALRNAGIKMPILVLHPQPINFTAIIDKCLEPSLYSPRILKKFLEAAKEKGQKKYPVHLKFNTGLNRLGFLENDIDFILEQLNGSEELNILSLFSHLAASEDENERKFTINQIEKFKDICQKFDEKSQLNTFKHILNTSGILNYPEAQFNMVRSGIGLYGFANNIELDKQLQPVMTLKTVISQLHKIEPNQSVGYNRKYTSTDRRITATLPIGHADGIGRQYGNGNAFVLINGKKAPIIGNVCMDMIMVDITNIECTEGDEVIVFGGQQTAEGFANSANTISYELITGISQRVKRVYIGN